MIAAGIVSSGSRSTLRREQEGGVKRGEIKLDKPSTRKAEKAQGNRKPTPPGQENHGDKKKEYWGDDKAKGQGKNFLY